MILRRLIHEFTFPDPQKADAAGLVAFGGSLDPRRVLAAYAQGIFPWPYDSDSPVLWFSPDPRMVLRPAELHVSRSLQKTITKRLYEVRYDAAFAEVIRRCATVRRPGQRATWITGEMIRAYDRLHELGVAHSAEAWREGQLVGGLYGVSLGAAFFGESMFALAPDASKVAFVRLVEQLRAWGIGLVDCQVYTDHLARFGAVEWPRKRYLTALKKALAHPTRTGPWRFDQEIYAPK